MNPALEQESEKLVRSWSQLEGEWLRDYLVSGVEDPRLNVQSMLSRHFLLDQIFPGAFGELMRHETRFAAAMNCLLTVLPRISHEDDLAAIHHALKQRSDNAEGIEIPQFLIEVFAAAPATLGSQTIPEYLESFLSGSKVVDGRIKPDEASLNTFRRLWNEALRSKLVAERSPKQVSVLEAACGSANDYRFLDAYGIAPWLDYTGFDLCERNIANARALFPAIRFEVGNVFQIAAPDKAFDVCLVHDLFEHLSLEGMETAVREVCRVTRRGLCVGFFSMDEVREHRVREVEEYHWNTLSMARMKDLFAQHGFAAQVIHIGTFLRREAGCEQTHNPNAYTFVLQSATSGETALSAAAAQI